MRIGCSVLNISELEVVRAAGYDYLELMGKYLVRLEECDFSQIRRILEEKTFICGGLNAYCPKDIVIAGPEYDLKKAGKYAEFCALRASVIGVECVGIGSPQSRRLPPAFGRKKADQQLRDFLKTTAEAFGKFGIKVCLEPLAPCYCNYINTIEEAVEIVEGIGWENIGIVADFYNMEYTGEADRDMKAFLPWLYHVHISDDAGGPDRRSHLKRERAAIHQERIGRLYESGYRGKVSVEVDLPVCPPSAGQSLAILRKALFSRRKREACVCCSEH